MESRSIQPSLSIGWRLWDGAHNVRHNIWHERVTVTLLHNLQRTSMKVDDNNALTWGKNGLVFVFLVSFGVVVCFRFLSSWPFKASTLASDQRCSTRLGFHYHFNSTRFQIRFQFVMTVIFFQIWQMLSAYPLLLNAEMSFTATPNVPNCEIGMQTTVAEGLWY